MVLKGFRGPAWAGWFSGVLFTNNPITFSVFKSWKSFYTLYVIIINLIFATIITDFVKNIHSANLQKEYVRNTIINGFLATFVVLLMMIKFYFILNAKAISSFLKTLELHPVSSVPLEQRKFQRACVSTNWISFGLCIVGSVVIVFNLTDQDFENSWFASIGKVCYMITAGLFSLLPSYLSMFVAFSFVCVPLSNIMWIFEDFCIQMENYLKVNTTEQAVVLFQTKYFGMLNGHGSKIDTRNRNNYNWTQRNLMDQFQKIKELFKKYDELAGPLLLVLIVNSTISIIQATTDIILRDAEYRRAHPATAWISLISNSIYLVLLNLGESAKNIMRTRKESLHQLIALTPDSSMKTELAGIVHVIDSWQWKLSASGFFSVDRSLMGGIISTMMSYVVILFQLHQGHRD